MKTFIAFLVVLAGGVLITGSAYMLLWRWFVAPLGVAEIAFWHAAGIGLLVNLPLTGLHQRAADDYEDLTRAEKIGKVVSLWVMYGVVIGLGGLFHIFAG